MNYHLPRLKYSLICLLFIGFRTLAGAQQLPDSFPASIPHADSLSETDLSGLLGTLVAHAGMFASELGRQAEQASVIYTDAGQRLDTARKDTLSPKSSLDSLSGLVKTAKKEQKEAEKRQKQAASALEFAEKVAQMDAVGQRKNLDKCYKRVRAVHDLLYPPAPEKPIAEIIGNEGVVATDSLPPRPDIPTEPVAEKAPEKGKTKEKAGPKFKPYDPSADVMLNPPPRPCSLAVNTRDEFSGETYQEVQKEELFRYTNEVMKKHLPPDQPHIICNAALSSGGATVSLQLHFDIRDNNARRTFGSLGKNSAVILKFLDGTTFTAVNVRSDEGTPGSEGQVFSFKGQYVLDPAAVKKLRKTELDKIRVAWSTGYEDYEIQNVDLLMRQAKCLFE